MRKIALFNKTGDEKCAQAIHRKVENGHAHFFEIHSWRGVMGPKECALRILHKERFAFFSAMPPGGLGTLPRQSAPIRP